MTESAVDVLLHPVRLRIVRALAATRGRTVAELAAQLSDVPAATLYRHVNRLAAAGLIAAASERQVRGAVERTYRLADLAGVDGSVAAAGRADQLRYFITFVATLIDDFNAYLERGEPDYKRDGVGYRQVPLALTDAEFRRFVKALSNALEPFAALPPSPKRKARFFTTIVMPAAPRRAS